MSERRKLLSTLVASDQTPPMASDNNQDDRTQSFTVLTAGTRISQYEIVEKIGAGGMGEVYLAEDTKLNRQVALKFLPPHLCQDEDCRKRFTREAQAAAALDHPNIAAIYEVGEFQGRPFYAMQIVEGHSLRDVIAGKDLPLKRILEIAVQLCEGLQAAHDKGIVHRDIKPSNILLDDHGRERIVDFGLASIRGSEQLTKTGSTLGTVGYMSPEQVKGKEVDQRSDLFSLGVVLYELTTKRNPFQRDTEAATLKAVSDDLPEPMARFKSGLPAGLQAVIDKALEKQPQTRYQHAEGMLSDLLRLTRSFESDRPSLREQSSKKGSPRAWWIAAALVVIAAVGVLVTKPWEVNSPQGQSSKIMLAVLPFENLGDPEDEYFADGMTEEITARLAVVHDLGVLARTSTRQYRQTDKSIQQIGKELGVNYILEGSIRWERTGEASGRIRVTPQLIRVSDATHVWAEIYDELVDRIFDVQTDIAQKVVGELNIVLGGSERKAIEAKPTNNLRAFELYTRGWEYRDRFRGEADLHRAQEMFEQAIALDSDFVAAYGSLSMLHSLIYWYGYDLTPERVEKAKSSADLAVARDPQGSWGQLALGYYYYYCKRDYDQALSFFERALVSVPNDPSAASATAYVKRRKGDFAEAARLQRRALEIDPLSYSHRLNLSATWAKMRRFDETVTLLKESIQLYPDDPLFIGLLSYTYLDLAGDVDSARAVLHAAAGDVDTTLFNWAYWTMAVIERDFDLAISIDPVGMDTVYKALDSADFYMHRAQALHWGGYEVECKPYYDSARVILEGLDKDVILTSPFSWPSLGMAYAGLGRKEDAIRAGKEMAEYLPLSKDAFDGTTPLIHLAEIYARVGEPDLACDLIDQLLSIPAYVTTASLRLNPEWDPLRDHPSFKALIE